MTTSPAYFSQECTDSLLNQLDQQLKITEDECKHYRESLEQLGEGDAQEHDQGALENEIEQVGKRVSSPWKSDYWTVTTSWHTQRWVPTTT